VDRKPVEHRNLGRRAARQPHPVPQRGWIIDRPGHQAFELEIHDRRRGGLIRTGMSERKTHEIATQPATGLMLDRHTRGNALGIESIVGLAAMLDHDLVDERSNRAVGNCLGRVVLRQKHDLVPTRPRIARCRRSSRLEERPGNDVGERVIG
jgi:hypothetical protein